MKILAAVCYDANAPLKIEEVELRDALSPNEVLVRNVSSGVCHTDITLRDMDPEIPFMPKPSILGHEGAGIVEKVGTDVQHLVPGDHVIMSYHYDGECPACLAGLNPYCENYLTYNLVGIDTHGKHAHLTPNGPASIMHQQSSFATYSIATDKNTYKVPKDLPLEYLGPVGCGFMTGVGGIMNMLNPKPGSSIAIFGLGAVGFAALAMAKQLGCSDIVVVDLHRNRLDLAGEFGATHLVDASQGNALEQIRAEFPFGVGYSFEATGVPAVMSQATEVLATNGHCLICGAVSDMAVKAEFLPFALLRNQHIHGSLMGHKLPKQTIDTVVSMIAAGTFPIEKLISVYEFSEINKAIEDSLSGKVIKSVVKMPGHK